MASQKINKIIIQLATYCFLIGLSIIILYPLSIALLTAFQKGNTPAFYLDFSRELTLENFQILFFKEQYFIWFGNTLKIAVTTMVLQVAVVVLAGYAYSRYRFAGRKQTLLFFLLIQMIPSMAALTSFYVLATLLKVLDQWWFLTILYVGGGIPMNIWLMKGYFDTVPREIDESGRIDGAGHLRIFWQLILPLVRPMIAVQALWAFMGPFGDFLLAKFLLRSPGSLTLAVALQRYVTDQKNLQYGLFSAGSILIAIPIALLFFVLQKNFVSGLTAGGTKG
ncbi:maltose transporter subunit [Erysipelotrichaceae bacterium]|nr:maltose transporter subunit [Erysipelotrichaceae bacterium]